MVPASLHQYTRQPRGYLGKWPYYGHTVPHGLAPYAPKVVRRDTKPGGR